MTCGEATMRLLARYGVDTVFGIPGVHTLDFCRGLGDGQPITHIQARNEQGAGFMADGYARVSGRPGVALVISGPGVTNAATPLGQSWADSVPVLLLSADTDSRTHGLGWGCLHEVTDQQAVTAPLTAMSATARHPDEVPALLAAAFSIFASQRPRPVHIAIPIDVQAMSVVTDWQPAVLPSRSQPDQKSIDAAAALLRRARRPLIMVGGGACGAAQEVRALAEELGAVVVASNAGKGVLPDGHPLSLGATTVRPEVQAFIAYADVVVAIGTELAETDSFVDRLSINGKLIRIDVDVRKMNDQYHADVPILSDAASAVAALQATLTGKMTPQGVEETYARVRAIHEEIAANLNQSEVQHAKVWKALREVLPTQTLLMGDITQLVYTGAFAVPVEEPRLWHYPAGYCTLGCGLPNAIGAKLAMPDRPTVVVAGDGGFMFTVQELMCAAELNLALPIILWNNNGLKQIQDDMRAREIPLVGVSGINPDFVMLAKACHCHALVADSKRALQDAVTEALSAPRPTLIVVNEGDVWLQ